MLETCTAEDVVEAGTLDSLTAVTSEEPLELPSSGAAGSVVGIRTAPSTASVHMESSKCLFR